MLRFTKRADYGLMAIHYIAVHDELGAVSTKRIAEEFGIPPELLAKILQRLAKRRLIVSQNGPKRVRTDAPSRRHLRRGSRPRARGADQHRELSRPRRMPAGASLQPEATRAEAADGDQPAARYHEPGRAEQPGRPRNTGDQVKQSPREMERSRWR